MYRRILRPLLFTLPPATAHALAFAALGVVEHSATLQWMIRASLGVPDDPRLIVRAMGLTFPSPLGLAGGFDKNARRPRALAALGFGHLELGTVTARSQKANPSPNLFRLKEDRALINRLGFPNEGAQAVAARLVRTRAVGLPVPVGVSIGKSRSVSVDDLSAVIADYVEAFDATQATADFIVVNVSSPNTAGLRTMQAGGHARDLLSALQARNTRGVPLLVKIAPDLDDAGIEAVLSVVEELRLSGVVATNTTIARLNLTTRRDVVDRMGAGGLSGPPLRARALDVVKRVRNRLGRGIVVMGVGGVERTDDALALLRAGADLVQMYTGLIYEGPAAPANIARGLLACIERSGSRSVADLRDTLAEPRPEPTQARV